MQLVRDDWFELGQMAVCSHNDTASRIVTSCKTMMNCHTNQRGELDHHPLAMLSSFLMQCSIKWVQFLLKFQNMGIYPDRIKVKVNKKIYLLSEISKKRKKSVSYTPNI